TGGDAGAETNKFANVDRWLDYTVRFEIKSTRCCEVFLRKPPRSRKAVWTRLPAYPKWTAITLRLESVILEVLKDGAVVNSDAVDYASGGLGFRILGPGTVQVRNLEILLQKTK
ncbi:MAG: hypothetical protein ACYTHN_12135, partial [Planctomycetota bacterium]